MGEFKRNQSITKSLSIGIYAKKVTQTERKKFMRQKLSLSSSWALKGLEKIYAAQTSDEQAYQTTSHNNNVGFGGADAEILSSFAEQYAKRKFLSPKQMIILYKKIPKYWRQLILISNANILDNMVKDARKCIAQ